MWSLFALNGFYSVATIDEYIVNCFLFVRVEILYKIGQKIEITKEKDSEGKASLNQAYLLIHCLIFVLFICILLDIV